MHSKRAHSLHFSIFLGLSGHSLKLEIEIFKIRIENVLICFRSLLVFSEKLNNLHV